MTTPSETVQNGPYVMDGATTIYPYTFRPLSPAELEVAAIDASGVETILTGYSVSALGAPGNVVFDVAPPVSASGLFVRINPAFTQDEEFENQGAFLPETITEGFDRAAQRDLYLREGLSRTPQFVRGSGPFALLLPTPGKVIGVDAGGQLVMVNPGGADSSLRADLASGVSGAALIALLGPGTGEISRTVKDAMLKWGAVDATRFGVLLDGSDDIVKLQKAADYALAQGRALKVPGVATISTSLMIDRLVDTTNSDFHIFFEGGGLTTANPIKLIDTNLPYVSDPQSERIIFHDGNISCASSATAAYVLSQKMLRIGFVNCRFDKIRCVTSSGYLQSIHFRDCYARRHAGRFIFANSFMFDLVADVQMEGIGTEQGYTWGLSYGALVEGGPCEGILGPIVEGPCLGFVYAVHYSEGNINPDVDFLHGAALTFGVHFRGGIILLSVANAANPAFFPVKLGDARGVTFSALYGSGNLIDDTYSPYGDIQGDVRVGAGLATKSGRSVNAAMDPIRRTTGITAAAGSTCATATQLNPGFSLITAVVADGHAVGLPTLANDPAAVSSFARVCVLQNIGAKTAAIFVSNFDGPNFGVACTIDGVDAFNANHFLAPNEIRTFYSVAPFPPTWRSFKSVPPLLHTSTTYANDAAAAAGGVPVGGFYRNGSNVMLRIA